MKTQPGCY